MFENYKIMEEKEEEKGETNLSKISSCGKPDVFHSGTILKPVISIFIAFVFVKVILRRLVTALCRAGG